jgi:hypothetical protein
MAHLEVNKDGLLVQLALQTWTCEVSNMLLNKHKQKWNKTNQKLKHNKSSLIWQTIVKFKMVLRTYGKKFVQDNQCNDHK